MSTPRKKTRLIERPAEEAKVIFEAARDGQTRDQIIQRLQEQGFGLRSLEYIRRSAGYQNGRKAAGTKAAGNRPYSEAETALIYAGALAGRPLKDIQADLKALDLVRTVGCIRASKPFKAGLGERRAAEALAASLCAPEPEPEATLDEPVEEELEPAAPRLVRRFLGVSLPFLAIQKDWGEVIAR